MNEDAADTDLLNLMKEKINKNTSAKLYCAQKKVIEASTFRTMLETTC